MTFQPRYKLSSQIQESIVRIEAFKEFLVRMPMLPSWLERLQLEARVEEIYHTTHIEGSLLTLPETRRVLIENEHIPGKTRSELEVKNAAEAREYFQQLTDDRITHELLHNLQHLFMKNVDPDKLTGAYRKCQVNITDKNTSKLIYRPPEYTKIESLMNELIEWTNRSKGKTHNLIRAAIFHIIFEKIHPFEDGNGRTGRMIESLILKQGGYLPYSIFSVTNYYDNHREDYYSALNNIPSLDKDITGWIEFVLNGLSSEMNRSWHRLAEYHRKALIINSAHQENANARQLWLLNELLENDQISLSVYNKEFHRVSDRTLRTDIEKFEKLKFIIRSKEGREVKIELNSDTLVFNENTGNE